MVGLIPESRTCTRCGRMLEHGRLSSPGELAVIWVGKKIGILRLKTAKVFAYRCPRCGLIQLESDPDRE